MRVFDTLRRRNFRLEAPRSECSFRSIGGGLALWSCYSPGDDAAHDAAHESVDGAKPRTGGDRPGRAGLESAEWPRDTFAARKQSGAGSGWNSVAWGEATRTSLFDVLPQPSRTAASPARLSRTRLGCRSLTSITSACFAGPARRSNGRPMGPMRRRTSTMTGTVCPPRTAGAGALRADRYQVRLDPLAALRHQARRDPQHVPADRLPLAAARQRLRDLGRVQTRLCLPTAHPAASADRGGAPPPTSSRGRKLSVTHTCNRIFARWGGNTIYAARFEPARGAPPCQPRG